VTSRYREPTVKVPIAFPQELYEWLREAAFHRREPMAKLVREAVEEHRRRLDPQLALPLGRR
jgi:predicted DNA-binding protein